LDTLSRPKFKLGPDHARRSLFEFVLFDAEVFEPSHVPQVCRDPIVRCHLHGAPEFC